MEREVICSLREVSKSYRVKKGFFAGASTEIKALDRVSLDIRRQEILGLVGESGCGKSTLARLVLGLERPSAGSVEFEGVDLSALDPKGLRSFRKRAQMVFQDPFSSLNPKKTIFQIVSQPLKIHRICPREELRAEVRHLLKMAGLGAPDAEDRYPHEFSGGQRQRIGIARALATRPDLVVLDEPTSALDVSIQAQIINLILDLQESRRITCLFISHDLPIVEFVSHRIAVMYRGAIVEIMPKEAFGMEEAQSSGRPHHPYTAFLMSSIPVPDLEMSDAGCLEPSKKAASRNEPALRHETGGAGACAFYSRCPVRTEECSVSRPELTQVAPGHFIACHAISQRTKE